MIDYISRWDAICVLNELMHKKPTYYELPLYDAIAAIKAIPAADIAQHGERAKDPALCAGAGGGGSDYER